MAKRIDQWWIVCDDGYIGPYKTRETAEKAIPTFRCRNKHVVSNIAMTRQVNRGFYSHEEIRKYE